MCDPPEVEMKTKTSIADDIGKQIALRAYFIWEHEGRPEGHGAEHWARAEAEIRSEQAALKTVAPKKPAKKVAAAKPAAKKAAPEKPAAKPIAAKAVPTKTGAKPKKAPR
jgi:hypothetical protein